MIPQDLPAWKKLTRLAAASIKTPIAERLSHNARFQSLSFSVADLLLDLSKQRLDENSVRELVSLADQCRMSERVTALMSGEQVNYTERRAALHTALRALPEGRPASVAADIGTTLERMVDFANAVRLGHWRGFSGKSLNTVIHLGIGGSHLGPELAVTALQAPGGGLLTMRFAANIDAAALDTALVGADPERTLFIIASKSFTTLETSVNARSARSWFLERTNALNAIDRHFVAVTSNARAAAEFGIPAANVFPTWDWVGGRYSLWSAAGLPVMLAIGPDGFRQLLSGARAVDVHFRSAATAENVPLLMALSGIWNYNFLGVTNHAILPYSDRLKLLPQYLQQLEMESNGKHVTRSGEEVLVHTAPIIWGGEGTNGQHAFHQLLHQGTRAFTADFILVATEDSRDDHHRWLLANGLAQSQALASGHEDDDPHRRVVGDHATTTIVLDSLTPRALGSLLAVYEHKVFCQGVIWDINSFDQYGVELGKRLAIPIFEQLGGKAALSQDVSTRGLIEAIRDRQRARAEPTPETGENDD